MLKFLSSILSFVLLFCITCYAQTNKSLCHNPFLCGDIENKSYHFQFEGSPVACGPNYNYFLACENNRTILHLYSGKYFVQAIDHTNRTLRVVDTGLQNINNCSSLPRYPLAYSNFSSIRSLLDTGGQDLYPIPGQLPLTFINCESSANSSHLVRTWPCVSGIPSSKYSYAVLGDFEVSEIPDMCTIYGISLVSALSCTEKNNCSYSDVYNGLLNGFELSWSPFNCKACEGRGFCIFSDDYSELVGCFDDFIRFVSKHLDIIAFALSFLLLAVIGVRCICGAPCVLAFLAYKWRRRHLSMYDNVENFLRGHNNLMPIMYSYSQIKKMTQGFRDKLGEGGYGTVYRGKLSSGRAVAVKILGKSKANGQEFINEVATIGRIHHVNVVQLIGFCVESKKRALVYDFMPNGSLEKYIFSSDGEIPLSCESTYKITLGIARGIEYLHKGCDMQILHFDIKPHNILLDEDFVPKVSDFGLAKLYPTEDSMVSLTAPRGTMGYMAPELFYKNIGGVSHKADVYSFGMLLMEMAGRRKNLNAFAEHSSQIYFPSWVYDQFNQGRDIEIESASEEEKKTMAKMMIVALWCIQMKPSGRPSMSRVIEMLEGDTESLQMPPKPFLSPRELRQS